MQNSFFTVEQQKITLPLSNIVIKIRPILMKEEKILLIGEESFRDSNRKIDYLDAIVQVVESCTEFPESSKNQTIHNLSYFDFCYIFIQLRKISKGETVSLSIKCSKCEADNPISKKIDDILFVKNHSINDAIKWQDPMVKISDTIGVSLKPVSLAFTLRMLRNKEFEKYSLLEIIEQQFYEHAESIVNGSERIESPTQEQLEIFFNSMTKDQFSKIANWFANDPVIRVDFGITCQNCKESIQISESIFHFFVLQ